MRTYLVPLRVVSHICNYLDHSTPHEGYEWLSTERTKVVAHIPGIIETRYKCTVTRTVNCLPLKMCNQCLTSHLGSHHRNIALMLSDRRNLTWRLTRYVEIWLLLQSKDMACGDYIPSFVYIDRHTRHASLCWMLVERWIFTALGYNVKENAVCVLSRNMTECQVMNHPEPCKLCGSSSLNDGHRMDFSARSVALFDCIEQEFFATLCMLERIAADHAGVQ